jgi:signal transduction histidine kinase
MQQSDDSSEARLLELQVLLEAILRHFPGVVVKVESTGPQNYEFLLVSDGCFDLLELSPEALREDAQSFCRLLLQPDGTKLLAQLRHSADSLEAVNWEGRLRTALTGMTKWVNVRLTPYSIAGRVVWDGFMANITRNKEHEVEMVESRKRLSELGSHLEKTQERERARIARELHDQIGGNLSAIKIGVSWLEARLPKKDGKAREKMKALEALVDDTAETIVRIGQDLRPGVLDLGLVAAIEWQAVEFAKRMGIECATDLAREPLGLDRDAEAALFSIFREMLTNVAKHAKASEVRVRLSRSSEELELSVADNGKGMQAIDRLKTSSFGMRGMEERAVQLGGTLVVSDFEPNGTFVAVRVPQRPATSEGAGA